MREFMRRIGKHPKTHSTIHQRPELYAYWWCPYCGFKAKTKIVNKGGYWEKPRPACYNCKIPMQEVRPCGQC